MKKSNLVITGVAIFMLSACGSSEDVDAVAADMMTGSDAVPEKDAKCLAKKGMESRGSRGNILRFPPLDVAS